MRWLLVAAAASAALAPPAGAGLVVETLAVGWERWDAEVASSAATQAGAASIALGVGWEWRWLQVGLRLDTAVRRTDFGLLESPAVRLERRDADLEVRARAPWRAGGVGVQIAAGLGRRRIGYRPDEVLLPLQGGALAVSLAPVHATTGTLAAEVLHDLGGGEVVLRAVWRRYALDLWGPDGARRHGADDVQLGMGFRVRVR